MPAFECLPDPVIDIILKLVDPNTFASLAILNRTWRGLADTEAHYKHHLANCPPWSPDDEAGTEAPSPIEGSLGRLRRMFAQQVRRIPFKSYLSPRKRVYKLTAPSTSSSLAFPYGEVFKFVFSPKGTWLLAISSSRIFMIHLATIKPEPYRELEVSRRPVAAQIAEDGRFLAVLSPSQRVTTYRLNHQGVHCIQSIMLESASATIALSSDCKVLAAAHDQYIEIISLGQGPDQAPTSKRTVACNHVDHLAFQLDDAFLVGTSTKRRKPSTIIIPRPRSNVMDDESPAVEDIGRLWTTEVLFPNTFQSCSHAVALMSKKRLAPRIFAFDVPADVFGVLDLDEVEYGPVTYALPSDRRNSSIHLSTAMPAITVDSINVAFPSVWKGVWLYSDPNRLNVNISKSDPSHEDAMTVQGFYVKTDEEIKGVQWVAKTADCSVAQRLIGVLPKSMLGQEDEMFQIKEPSDTGRLMILDFSYAPHHDLEDDVVEEIELNLNVGEIETLEDDQIQLDTLLPSPRTELSASASRAMRRQTLPLGRSITSAGRGSRRVTNQATPTTASDRAFGVNNLPRIPSGPRRSSTTASASSRGRGEDGEPTYEDPYSHSQPRSRTALHRAATVAAVTRRQHLQTLPSEPLRFRRADGRGELPHESDADNWVPPPPPYAPQSDVSLPLFLRHSSMMSHRHAVTTDGAEDSHRLTRSRSFDDELAQRSIGRSDSMSQREAPRLSIDMASISQEPSHPSPEPTPMPSPAGLEARPLAEGLETVDKNGGKGITEDELDRPMSSNLANGWYFEPFPVAGWIDEGDEEPAEMTGSNIRRARDAQPTAAGAQEMAVSNGDDARTPPVRQFEPDHYYDQVNSTHSQNGSPRISYSMMNRTGTDYYGPHNRTQSLPYQDRMTEMNYSSYPQHSQSVKKTKKLKKAFKCAVM